MLHFPARTISIRKCLIALQESEITKLFLYQVHKAHNSKSLFYTYFNFEISLRDNDTRNFLQKWKTTSVHVSIKYFYHQNISIHSYLCTKLSSINMDCLERSILLAPNNRSIQARPSEKENKQSKTEGRVSRQGA